MIGLVWPGGGSDACSHRCIPDTHRDGSGLSRRLRCPPLGFGRDKSRVGAQKARPSWPSSGTGGRGSDEVSSTAKPAPVKASAKSGNSADQRFWAIAHGMREIGTSALFADLKVWDRASRAPCSGPTPSGIGEVGSPGLPSGSIATLEQDSSSPRCGR